MPCGCSRAKAHAAPLPIYQPGDAPPKYSESDRQSQTSTLNDDDDNNNDNNNNNNNATQSSWPNEKQNNNLESLSSSSSSSSPPRESKFKRFISKIKAHENPESLQHRMHTSNSHLSNDVTRAL